DSWANDHRRSINRAEDHHGISVWRRSADRFRSDAGTCLGLEMPFSLARLVIRSDPAGERSRALKEDERGRWAKATAIWQELAEKGDADALHMMGERYERGQGVVQNFAESERWYRRAAEAGNRNSQSKLG